MCLPQTTAFAPTQNVKTVKTIGPSFRHSKTGFAPRSCCVGLAKRSPSTHPQLVGTIDLLPTILAAVGLADEISPDMKGMNLLPSARGEKDLPVRPVFGAIYPNDAKRLDSPASHVRGRWIRWGDDKLFLAVKGESQRSSGLFNLRSDPNESKNLIDEVNQQQRVAELTTMLE